jgi:hypothetical protein
LRTICKKSKKHSRSIYCAILKPSWRDRSDNHIIIAINIKDQNSGLQSHWCQHTCGGCSDSLHEVLLWQATFSWCQVVPWSNSVSSPVDFCSHAQTSWPTVKQDWTCAAVMHSPLLTEQSTNNHIPCTWAQCPYECKLFQTISDQLHPKIMELWNFTNQLAYRNSCAAFKWTQTSSKKERGHTKTSSWSRRSCLLCLDRCADARLDSILHTIQVRPRLTCWLSNEVIELRKEYSSPWAKVLWQFLMRLQRISYSRCQNMSHAEDFSYHSLPSNHERHVHAQILQHIYEIAEKTSQETCTSKLTLMSVLTKPKQIWKSAVI